MCQVDVQREIPVKTTADGEAPPFAGVKASADVVAPPSITEPESIRRAGIVVTDGLKEGGVTGSKSDSVGSRKR